jgi:hypothetical protein
VTVFVVVLVRKQSASSEVSAIVRYGIYNKTRKWFHLEKMNTLNMHIENYLLDLVPSWLEVSVPLVCFKPD